MATIRKELRVNRPAAEVWAAFRDFGAVHAKLARGFVTDTRLEEGARVVTFANGLVATERLVTMDEPARRLVYAVTGSERLSHHNASFQVFEDGAGARIVWIADILPDAAAAVIEPMMEAGAAAMRTTLG
ncbi:MAG TPA: SRPBCC family protein [Vitreimonas sp.]|uniref:SRPBCC family protein n=1 Tax=Vitreimonas sp. TaxID=3069702 RepID=UPI002D3444FE|nr:SRPBCC family protein [Vitreimonas sp.]HYD89128.1 SRPBCC family protein [Vitreimonas sp.]